MTKPEKKHQETGLKTELVAERGEQNEYEGGVAQIHCLTSRIPLLGSGPTDLTVVPPGCNQVGNCLDNCYVNGFEELMGVF